MACLDLFIGAENLKAATKAELVSFPMLEICEGVQNERQKGEVWLWGGKALVLVPFPRSTGLDSQHHKALNIYDSSSSSVALNLSVEQEQGLIENGFTLFKLLHDDYEDDGGSMKETEALGVGKKVGMVLVSPPVV